MREPSEADIDEIVELFGVDTDSVELTLQEDQLRLYCVTKPVVGNCEVLIVDTPEARALACFPHIVGKAFDSLNETLATRAANAIVRELGLEEWKGHIVLLHILRASPGYKLSKALAAHLPDLREAYVRPLYSRDRSSLRVVYENYTNLPRNSKVAVIVPDTIATGRAASVSLNAITRALRARGCEPELLVLYGFIAQKGLAHVVEKALELGFERIAAFALVDLSALASNDYDMVLYGPDLSRDGFKPLGSIVPRETLKACAPHYVPGLDQPGDWSARQEWLFNGRSLERGNMHEHVEKTRAAVTDVLTRFGREAWFKDWHRKACRKALQALEAVRRRLAIEARLLGL